MESNKSKPKVLVVDDNPVNVELISVFLEFDYQVIPAYSGKEALEKLSSEKPDIVLLDIMMPETDGYQVCEKIKQHDTTRFIPVVMVTALTEMRDKIKAIEVGADDFLSKPINGVELMTRVKSLLKSKYYHDQLLKSKEKIEAQHDFKTVIANLLPLLLKSIPPERITEVIGQMGKQVESVIWEKYIHELPKDMSLTAEISCNIMNRLGGEFSVETVSDKKYTLRNNRCPWGDYGNISPVLCMLTRAICARIGVHVYNDINVEIKKTIAGGDGFCLVEVFLSFY